MASIAPAPGHMSERRFFLGMAVTITILTFGGFSIPVILGFVHPLELPWQVHVHALVFSAWILLYLAQNLLVARGAYGMHRRLGRAGGGLMGVMLVVGVMASFLCLKRGAVPPFFTAPYFLMTSLLTLFAFLGLAVAAIAMRRDTAWHSRLMLCATAMVMTPAFGRMLPMPLLGEFGPWCIAGGALLLIGMGMIFDLSSRGRVHKAWWAGSATILSVVPIGMVLASLPPVIAVAEGLQA